MKQRIATEEEAEDAVDLIIPAGDLKRQTAARRAEERRQRRAEWWRQTGKNATILAQWGVIFGLGAFVFVRPPQETQVPIVVYQRPDGTVTNYARWEDLPDHVRNDSVVNVAWAYVQERESWFKPRAEYSYNIVSALSSKPVREAFQAWADPSNPDSPQRRYRDGTAVQVQWINWGPVCPSGGCTGQPDTYRIEYARIETPPGGQPINRGTYTADVTVRRNVPLASGNEWLRWTVNPALVQVVAYSGNNLKGLPQ